MNNEQTMSAIRSLLLYVLGIGSTLLVTKGVLTADQASTLVPEIATVVLGIGAVAIGWWGHNSHSASAITAAVNSSSVPGVKAVAASSPSPPVEVDPTTGAVKPLTPQVK